MTNEHKAIEHKLLQTAFGCVNRAAERGTERGGQVPMGPAIFWGSPEFQNITIMTFAALPLTN